MAYDVAEGLLYGLLALPPLRILDVELLSLGVALVSSGAVLVCKSLAGVSHTERYVVSSDSGAASASGNVVSGVCAIGSDAGVADVMRAISLCGALTTDDGAGLCNDAAGRSYICATLLIVSSFILSATITTTATEAAADRAKATRRMVFVRLRLLSRGAGAAALLSSIRSAILSHNPSGTVALWPSRRSRSLLVQSFCFILRFFCCIP